MSYDDWKTRDDTVWDLPCEKSIKVDDFDRCTFCGASINEECKYWQDWPESQ